MYKASAYEGLNNLGKAMLFLVKCKPCKNAPWRGDTNGIVPCVGRHCWHACGPPVSMFLCHNKQNYVSLSLLGCK